jgi:hypothetical protein
MITVDGLKQEGLKFIDHGVSFYHIWRPGGIYSLLYEQAYNLNFLSHHW